jgi:hypothetical protein
MKTGISLVCVLLLGTVSAWTQTPPAGPKPAASQSAPAPGLSPAQAKSDPAKGKDIRRLLELAGTKAIMAQNISEMEKTIRPLMQNSLPAGDYREKLIEAFFAKFKSKIDLDQLLDLAVPIYDKYLTHEEIKGLIQFYQTPLGQKAIGVLPKLSAELMDESRKLGENAGRQSMMEVLAEHPEFEKAIEEAQKAAQPPG